nr:MAG TPA: hypothetical protein [Microviridae sp.]
MKGISMEHIIMILSLSVVTAVTLKIIKEIFS